jgi:hypothetical protein
VVVVSSGAALNTAGSPLSGGYAGAKATQRFITPYAQDEAKRACLDITFTTLLPRFAPMTDVGRPAVHRLQVVEDFLQPITNAMQTQFLTTRAAAGHMVKRHTGVILHFGGGGTADVGPEYELPVFEPQARRLLSRVEPIARHYDVKKAPESYERSFYSTRG